MSDLVRSMIPRTMSCFIEHHDLSADLLHDSEEAPRALHISVHQAGRDDPPELTYGIGQSQDPWSRGNPDLGEKEGTRLSATMDARMAASEYSMSASWTGPKSTRRDPAGRRSVTASLISEAGPEKSSPTCIAWIVLLLSLMIMREPAMAASLSFSIPSSSSAAERMLSENPCMPRVFVSALLISGERALVNPLREDAA